ncbi:MAG: SH3 domain-containing protein [Rhodothermales bacterium]
MRFFVFASLLLLTVPATAQVGTLLPVDEAATDPSFVLFRARLLEAAQARDTSFVLDALDPTAKLSFGGDEGIEGFRRLWLAESRYEDEDVWTVLTRTVALGSLYDPGEGDRLPSATVPYVFGTWPDSLDVFEHGAIVGEHVRVRAAPDTTAEVLTALTFALVPTPYEAGVPEGWRAVTLADGRTGFVAARYVRSPIGYRMGFVREDGRWRITFFIAGD